MPQSAEQQRKRYAEDPMHRERKLAANRAYRAEHRDRLNALRREKLRSNLEFREQRRARHRMTYGLSTEDYERMVKEQNGACAMCKRKRKLCIDHCHATRMVRGLLCNNCNTALGLLDDDADLLREGGAYIDRWRGSGIRAAVVMRAEAGRFRLS